MDASYATVRAVLDAPSPAASSLIDALFRRESKVPTDVVRREIGLERFEALLALGLARDDGATMVGTVRLTRFGGQLIGSDRLGFRNHADFVLGPGPATASLARVVRPIDRGRALDLGTGPGSLGLWLAAGGADVLGLDISNRAIAFASFNGRLNAAARATFRPGDFLTAPPDPALDEQFDVAVANPPFVLAPQSTLVYRDGPLPGDDTTRVGLERVSRSLAPGGRGYVIGSWADDGRGRWDARPRAWLAGRRGRALITRISSVTPADYVRSWTRDLNAASSAVVATRWLDFLETRGIGRITTGVIAVAQPRRRAWRRGVVEVLETARPGWRAIEAILAG
ncbi:MAG TPA: methyltransferase domain-containing protein [Candidatus Limnocylindrales bacterium]|nr:methyltransferase domain-containing protein [Candidatus Limnocylindrales bacterium]